MAKYNYKVNLTDGTTKIFNPLTIENVELYHMDKYINDCGDLLSFYKIIGDKLNISSSLIDNIKIIQTSKGIEFSIVSNNPYLKNILLDVEKKKIRNYKNYEMDTMVVSSNNSGFIEMKNFLFNNLENNSTLFFNEIYKYNNDFSSLLYKYSVVYNSSLRNEEDLRNLNELKNKIKIGLSIYKNYRGLCKARYEYENRVVYSSNIRNNNKETYTYTIPEYKEKEITQEDINRYNNFINYLEEEKEEFLEVDEIESEYDYGKRRY